MQWASATLPSVGRVGTARLGGDMTSAPENGIHGSSQWAARSMLAPGWLTTRLGELPRGGSTERLGKERDTNADRAMGAVRPLKIEPTRRLLANRPHLGERLGRRPHSQ
jgi:hypothetical protein